MKRSNYIEEQVTFALKQAELGTAVPEICRKMAVSEATLCTWRQKFGDVSPSELSRLLQLEEECDRLNRLIADLSIARTMLQDALEEKL